MVNKNLWGLQNCSVLRFEKLSSAKSMSLLLFPTLLGRTLKLLGLVALACGQIAALAAEDLSVPGVAGIRVVAFTPDPLQNESDPVNKPWSSFSSPFQALGQGTHINLIIPSPSGGFVSPAPGDEPEVGKVLKVVDSRGKDLTMPRIHQFMGNEWPMEARISDLRVAGDGSSAIVTLFAPQTPTPGAGRIDLSAEVTLKHCPETKEFKAPGVKLRSEGAFQMGPIKLTVGEVKSFEHHGRQAEVLGFETTDACENLRAIELQADGKTLKTIDAQSVPNRNRAGSRKSFFCSIKGLPDQVDVVASFYQDFDKPNLITFPVTVSAGLGLTAGEDGEATLSKVGPEDTLVTVAGLEIVDPSIARRVNSGRRIRGTTIALTLVREDGGMIKIDPKQSKIGEVTDSAGKDLTAPIADVGNEGEKILPRFGDAMVSEEGTSAGIEIELPQAPSSGSNNFRFSASIALLCCDETVEFKATPTNLNTTGAKFEAGPFRFEVVAPEAVGEKDRRQPCKIRMKTRRDLKEIKQVTLKVDGRILVARSMGRGLTNGETDVMWTIPELDKLPASAELVVTVYKDLKSPKTVMVPVEGTIGLGLPAQR
jgi:hypothetical protein